MEEGETGGEAGSRNVRVAFRGVRVATRLAAKLAPEAVIEN